MTIRIESSPKALRTDTETERQIAVVEEPWRLFRIMGEFVEGFETLSKLGPAVTVFGSSRMKPSHPAYKLADRVSRGIAKLGFAVVTGGGPGIMEAANKGAFKAGGKSIGLNINLPTEQKPNIYQTQQIFFKYFFCRKVCFIKYTSAVLVFPGGFGTMDEMFEILTLIQTQKIKPIPLVLVGKNYWKGLLRWIQKTMAKDDMIAVRDMGLLQLADTEAEILKVIRACKVQYSILEYADRS